MVVLATAAEVRFAPVGGVVWPATGRRVADHAGPKPRTGPVGGGPDDPARDVLAWPPSVGRVFEQERLAAIDRECLHLDHRLSGGRAHLINIGLADLAIAVGNEALHGKIVSAVRLFS